MDLDDLQRVRQDGRQLVAFGDAEAGEQTRPLRPTTSSGFTVMVRIFFVGPIAPSRPKGGSAQE